MKTIKKIWKEFEPIFAIMGLAIFIIETLLMLVK